MKSTLENTVNANLLKHACGTAMFCPGCGKVLDCRNATLYSVKLRKRELARVVCNTCSLEYQHAIREGAEKTTYDVKVEAIRGTRKGVEFFAWTIRGLGNPAKKATQLELPGVSR